MSKGVAHQECKSEREDTSMMEWGYGYGWPMMVWMSLWGIFWLTLLGLVIWALIRWLNRSTSLDTRTSTTSSEPSAMEILQQRYARGEIDPATFEQMREHLEARRERQPVGGN